MRALRALLAGCAAVLGLGAVGPAHAIYESGQSGSFDYYVLALSRSPTFCASHPADHAECGVRRGFVVHGLWPQYKGGGGPEHRESTVAGASGSSEPVHSPLKGCVQLLGRSLRHSSNRV